MCVVRQSAPILGPKRPKIWKKWGSKNHIFANEAILSHFLELQCSGKLFSVSFRFEYKKDRRKRMDPVRQTAISKFDLFRFRNLGYGSFSELLHFLSVTIVIYAKSCSRPHTQLKKSKIACAKLFSSLSYNVSYTPYLSRLTSVSVHILESSYLAQNQHFPVMFPLFEKYLV